MDLDRTAAAASANRGPSVSAGPERSEVAGANMMGVEALEASARGREQTEQRRRIAIALMAAEMEKLRASLEAAYFRELEADVEATARQLTSDLAADARERADAVVAESLRYIRATAPRRGRLVARLSLIVGFPDPGPTQRPLPEGASGVERELAESADRLRAGIAQMDAGFEQWINALLEAERVLSETGREDLAARIEEAYRRAATEAAREAAERMERTGRLELPSLLDTSAGRLAAQPERRIEVPVAEARLRPAQELEPWTPRKEVVETQLRIWLRIQGYKLARGPEGAPDKTAEFVSWLSQR